VRVADATGHEAPIENLAEQILSQVMLRVLDEKWKDHLYDLDQLRNTIGFRGWGQRDPLVEYKKEAYDMFVDLMGDLRGTFTEQFLKVQVTAGPPPPPQSVPRTFSGPVAPGEAPPKTRQSATADLVADDALVGAPRPPVSRSLASALGGAARGGGLPPGWDKMGRNDPCPCGSGKKFKKCHGAGM
jgi:preprotein translocase subunit SecA